MAQLVREIIITAPPLSLLGKIKAALGIGGVAVRMRAKPVPTHGLGKRKPLNA